MMGQRGLLMPRRLVVRRTVKIRHTLARNAWAFLCSVINPVQPGALGAGNQIGAQRSAQHGVERHVDDFVANLKTRVISAHPLQNAYDLFGRMTLSQKVLDMGPTIARPDRHLAVFT